MKYLIAVDSAETADRLVAFVKKRRIAPPATFCVLHVVDTRSFLSLSAGLDQLLIEETEAAHRLVKYLGDQLLKLGYTVEPAVTQGHPRHAVLEYAKTWTPDVVIMGALGHSRLERFFIGSVAKSVLRDAPCSVLLVRPLQTIERKGEPLRVVLAVDGSAGSLAAINFVAEQTWPPGSEVRVVSVIEELRFLAEPWIGQSEINAQWVAEETAQAKKAIGNALELLNPTGVTVSTATLDGLPKTTIVEEAERFNADLVVVGTHGRHGVDRLVLGSVSEFVATHATCSVEIVRGIPSAN